MKDLIELFGYILLTIIMFFFLADTKISFSPFSIKCYHIMKAIGWITIIVGISLVIADTSKTRYKQGVEDGAKYATDEVNKALEDTVEKHESIDTGRFEVDIKQDFEDEKQEPSNLDK